MNAAPDDAKDRAALRGGPRALAWPVGLFAGSYAVMEAVKHIAGLPVALAASAAVFALCVLVIRRSSRRPG